MAGGVGGAASGSSSAAAASFFSSKLLTAFLLASSAPSSSALATVTTRAAPTATVAALSFNRSLPATLLSSSSSSVHLPFSYNRGLGHDPRAISQRSSRQRRQLAIMASSDSAPSIAKVEKTEGEWRTLLSPEQFRILRQKGTEWAGTGKYDKFKEDGVYECAGCGTPLYKSTTKFNSGCGWPAFFEGLPGAITETPDADGRRIEITCTACGGHLGHNFRGEGFPTPTNERHCVNSISLKFTPASK